MHLHRVLVLQLRGHVLARVPHGAGELHLLHDLALRHLLLGGVLSHDQQFQSLHQR